MLHHRPLLETLRLLAHHTFTPHTRTHWLSYLLKRVDRHDPNTFEHSSRVSKQLHDFGSSLLWSPTTLQDAEDAAWLHDLGKTCVPLHILNKPSRLTPHETDVVRTHVNWGATLLNLVPLFQNVARIVQDHHEHWDGTGYPNHKAGADINPIARALSIVDTFDVITHARSYKTPRTTLWAFEELRRCAGTQFDPILVEQYILFLSLQSSYSPT